MNLIINLYDFSAHTFVSPSTVLEFVFYDHPQQSFNREFLLITRRKRCIQGRVQNTMPPFINVEYSASTQR